MRVPVENATPILAWCPTCRDHALPEDDGACTWCGTQTGGGEPPELIPRAPHRPLRKGDPAWGPTCRCGHAKTKEARRCGRCALALRRRRRKAPRPRPVAQIPACIRLDDLEECRHLYATGLSLREVAERIYPRTEYKSVGSCLESLRSLWRTRGWKLRPQSAVTATRNHRHGRRASNPTAAEQIRERWQQRPTGQNPQCEGTTARTGQRCGRPAMTDSRYCHSHSDDRLIVAERHAHLATARAHLTTDEPYADEQLAA